MMFWLEILLPVSMAIVGIAILFSNDRAQIRAALSLVESGRAQFREFAGRQQDKSQIKERLEELGSTDSYSYKDFRYRQALVGVAFGFLPFVLNFLMILNLFQAISFSVFMGIGAYLAYDKHLNSLVKQRRELIEAEFPAIIEMLTLAIAAGETPIGAIARVADRSDSYLAKEFALVVQQVRQGRPFHEALDEMSRSLKSPSIRRFIDALVMALVRGAPVVEVLHRHVAEARINQRNLVMDKAGKAETTMMIPIVFLILPISVLFALWPSINQLSFFAS
jgi:tight adherence protein C